MDTYIPRKYNEKISFNEYSEEIKKLQSKVNFLESENKRLSGLLAESACKDIAADADKDLQKLYNDLLLIHCPDMIFLFNCSQKLLMCSHSCAPILSRMDKDELISQPLTDIFTYKINREWVERIQDQHRSVLSTLEPIHYNDTIVIKDNNEFVHVHISISPVIENNGRRRGTVMSLSNITELLDTKKQAEQALKMKTGFLANVSHEIRTPMNAIKGLSELLMRTNLNELQYNYTKNIVNSSQNLLSIINDVLDFSKIDAEKMEFVDNDYQTESLISDVCGVIHMHIGDKLLDVVLDVSPQMPITLFGDELRIKQVLTNLMSNAVKYTCFGYVRLLMQMKRICGKTYLCCSVKDTGSGIKDEDKHLLFKVFSRADIKNNRGISGTGLGLAIAKSLTEAMGGQIWFESEYGKGSEFYIQIPQRIVDSTPIVEFNPPKNKKVLLILNPERTTNLPQMLKSLGVEYYFDTLNKGYSDCIFDQSVSENDIRYIKSAMPGVKFTPLLNISHPAALSDEWDSVLYTPLFIKDLVNMLSGENSYSNTLQEDKPLELNNTTILVVDDSDVNLMVSREQLNTFSPEVECAASGKEAVDMCKKKEYDLIFMDHMMPEMDGLYTTRLIRNCGQNITTPIIALTANSAQRMQSEYILCGMDDFLSKPIDMESLARILVKWLPRNKTNGWRSKKTIAESCLTGSRKFHSGELVKSLDNFGMSASKIMSQFDGDFEKYIELLDTSLKSIVPIINFLKMDIERNAIENFVRNSDRLKNILHQIGIEDLCEKISSYEQNLREENLPQTKSQFTTLDNEISLIYKKLNAVVKLAKSGDTVENPLNKPKYIYDCLEAAGDAINSMDVDEALKQIENASVYSLDKNLDVKLNDIRRAIEQKDFSRASAVNSVAISGYADCAAIAVDD